MPANVEITDEGLVNGLTYHYAAFPYSDHGSFNTDSDENNIEATPSEQPVYKMWAFDQDFTNLDPDTTITYPEGFENSDYEPMAINFAYGNDNLTPGGWLSFLKDVLHNEPYYFHLGDGLNEDGTINYDIRQLDPMDYTKTVNGSNSDIPLTGLNQGEGLFAWLNKIYTKEIYSTDGNSRRVIFSDGPVDEDFYPIGFVNQNNEEMQGVWIPMGFANGNGVTNTDWNLSDVRVNDTQYFMPSSAPSLLNNRLSEMKKFCKEVEFFGGPIFNVIRDLEYLLFKNTNIQMVGNSGSQYPRNIADGSSDYVLQFPSNTVPGFLGFRDTDTNLRNKFRNGRLFHSWALANYGCVMIDPYMTVPFYNSDLYVSDNYNRVDLASNDDATRIITSTYKKAEGISYQSNVAYGQARSSTITKLIHCGKTIGSLPYFSDKNADGYTTGMCDFVCGFNGPNQGNHSESRCRILKRQGYDWNTELMDQNNFGPCYLSVFDVSDSGSTYCQRYNYMILPNKDYTPY